MTQTRAPRRDRWAEFNSALEATLAGLPSDSFLIISVDDPGDESEDDSYFVQFAQGGEKGFRAEAVSNRFLSERHRLDERAQRKLGDLGWLPPDEFPEGPRSNVNHYREWPRPAPFGDAARLAVSTLRRVFRVRSPARLVYRCFDEENREYLVPLLGIRHERDSPGVSPSPGDPGLDLRLLVESTVRQRFGLDQIIYDPDGDIPVRFGSAMLFIRLLDRDLRACTLLSSSLGPPDHGGSPGDGERPQHEDRLWEGPLQRLRQHQRD